MRFNICQKGNTPFQNCSFICTIFPQIKQHSGRKNKQVCFVLHSIYTNFANRITEEMIVCIAEKPSVAKDIARILGAKTSRDGYMEGNGYQVTWTFGHLCELKEPNDYSENWKHWSLAALPMIPLRFGIKLIPDDGIKKQFATIEKLYSQADEIINCGDAGQEGELIQRWVMQKAHVKCPVKRLWISSMTDEA